MRLMMNDRCGSHDSLHRSVVDDDSGLVRLYLRVSKIFVVVQSHCDISK